MASGGGLDGREEETQRRCPAYLDKSNPILQDGAVASAPEHWAGANEITFKLLRCVEAARDLSFILNGLVGRPDEASERRLAKILATPLYSLADGLRDMVNELLGGGTGSRRLSRDTRKDLGRRLARFLADVPIDKGGQVKTIRDQISAHVDQRAVMAPDLYWAKVDFAVFVKFLRSCLELLLHLLNLDVYAWCRDPNDTNYFHLMSVDGTLTHIALTDGKASHIAGVTFTKYPSTRYLNT